MKQLIPRKNQWTIHTNSSFKLADCSVSQSTDHQPVYSFWKHGKVSIDSNSEISAEILFLILCELQLSRSPSGPYSFVKCTDLFVGLKFCLQTRNSHVHPVGSLLNSHCHTMLLNGQIYLVSWFSSCYPWISPPFTEYFRIISMQLGNRIVLHILTCIYCNLMLREIKDIFIYLKCFDFRRSSDSDFVYHEISLTNQQILTISKSILIMSNPILLKVSWLL